MATAAPHKISHARVSRTASGRRVGNLSLADPEMTNRVEALKARLTGSPEDSIKFLKKVGIINRSGKLSKNFGG